MRFGIEYDDGHYCPAKYVELDAENITTAWIRANRLIHRVMVVFSLSGPYQQATRLDYSPETGSGDPH